MISNEKNNTLFLPEVLSAKKTAISVAVLVIFHLVGLWGLLLSGNAGYFQNLTPLNLLVTVTVLFLNHTGFNKAFFWFVGITFLAGFLAEVIGIHTGVLFGNYVYGEALGFKVWEVPVLIGVNWVMLVYCGGILARKWLSSPVLAAFLGALLMVGLDYLIEPVAIQYDFWSWQNNHIPVWNFVCWFGLALVLQLNFQLGQVSKTNPVAPAVFVIQALFFFALNMFL